ncbi:MAG: protein-L-isoaspartate(D-aspartate) O-methyltransferase, partial [Bryobacteraceae bacterium]
AELRRRMVERQLRARGIRDPRVLAAMARIPRELFVPENLRERAYDDEPLPIGFGQTISQPYMVALMVQALELNGDEKVLEVGAGSGYHAAVLGALAREVIAVEVIPELAARAQQNLEAAGCAANVRVICADGSLGYPELAPYHAISVAAAAAEIPWPLLEQLADPGRMVIPVGSGWDQELRLIGKRDGRFTQRVVAFCRFVPLRQTPTAGRR